MWNIQKINELRLKLGWSRAELCHRLAITLKIFEKIEKSEVEIDKEMIDALDRLKMVSETASDHIHKLAKVDSLMRENNLSKVIIDSGKEDI